MGVSKAQLLEHPPGANVPRVVSSEERGRTQGPEGMVDDRARRLGRHSLAPLLGAKLELEGQLECGPLFALAALNLRAAR